MTFTLRWEGVGQNMTEGMGWIWLGDGLGNGKNLGDFICVRTSPISASKMRCPQRLRHSVRRCRLEGPSEGGGRRSMEPIYTRGRPSIVLALRRIGLRSRKKTKSREGKLKTPTEILGPKDHRFFLAPAQCSHNDFCLLHIG